MIRTFRKNDTNPDNNLCITTSGFVDSEIFARFSAKWHSGNPCIQLNITLMSVQRKEKKSLYATERL